ncbi:MAG: restriction endonuclease [Candidatus Portiera sp.]|nr:restriction endonuclease [Portiera sp.]
MPNKEKEKLDLKEIEGGDIKKKGLVYIFALNKKIFKIGHTITSIKKRVGSYNCGTRKYRERGTNSTTNYFILQSLLNINRKVNVYAFFPVHPKYEIFGEKFQDSYPAAKTAEKKIIKHFEDIHKKKPIGCTTT